MSFFNESVRAYTVTHVHRTHVHPSHVHRTHVYPIYLHMCTLSTFTCAPYLPSHVHPIYLHMCTVGCEIIKLIVHYDGIARPLLDGLIALLKPANIPAGMRSAV